MARISRVTLFFVVVEEIQKIPFTHFGSRLFWVNLLDRINPAMRGAGIDFLDYYGMWVRKCVTFVQEASWDFAPVEHPEGTRFNYPVQRGKDCGVFQKLTTDLVFDNGRMMGTGFRARHLQPVFQSSRKDAKAQRDSGQWPGKEKEI